MCIRDRPFTFGSFTLQFFNTVTDLSKPHAGENVSSVGVKVTKGKRTAFLAADISAEGGLENRMAPLVGKVDLLKVGHHGYTTATNPFFIRTLHPEIAIVTNQLGKIYPNVKWNLVMIAHASVYATVNHNGIIATFKMCIRDSILSIFPHRGKFSRKTECASLQNMKISRCSAAITRG